MDSTKTAFMWWSITDLASAHKVSLQGLWPPAFIIGSTLFKIISHGSEINFLGNGIGLLIHYGILVLVAFGIYNKFRIAPIIGIILYLLPVVLFSADPYGGIAAGIFILLFYINSARGIYYWHIFMKAEASTP